MISTELYLRRCLFAPVILPVLACGSVGVRCAMGLFRVDDPISATSQCIAIVLGASFILGAIPYLWMMFASWGVIGTARGRRLEQEIWTLPYRMLPYYMKSAIALAAVICFAYGVFHGSDVGCVISAALSAVIIGLPASLVFGYGYIVTMFGYLRLFRAFGLVEQ